MKHKYIFHLKIYHHIYGREGGTLGCLGAGERPGDSVEDTQGLCNQAGGRSHQMRLVGPDANGRCQSVGQKIFQCCQPPATTTLPSISPLSTLPSLPFPAPARPDHSSTDHIISNSTSPSLSSAPPLSSPNMPLLGEIIVLLETIVRVEISHHSSPPFCFHYQPSPAPTGGQTGEVRTEGTHFAPHEHSLTAQTTAGHAGNREGGREGENRNIFKLYLRRLLVGKCVQVKPL